jgi:DNA-binding NarL/FixJ family response regulator
MDTIRILIVDDNKFMRDELRGFIEKQRPVMDVIAEAGDGASAVVLAKKLHPHVVLMDVSMPDLNGMHATRRITADQPEVKVIALSMHSDRYYILEMFKAGAVGYLLKDCDFDELISAIQSVMENRNYLGKGLDTGSLPQ